jgi:hypothetical protein
MAYQSQLELIRQRFQQIPTRKPQWTWEAILHVHLPAQRANSQRDPRFSAATNPDFFQYRSELQIWRNLCKLLLLLPVIRKSILIIIGHQPGVGGPPFPGIAPPMHLPPVIHYYHTTVIHPPPPPPPVHPIPPQPEPTIHLPPPPPQPPQPIAAAPATTSLPPENTALPPAYPPPLTDAGSVPVAGAPGEVLQGEKEGAGGVEGQEVVDQEEEGGEDNRVKL